MDAHLKQIIKVNEALMDRNTQLCFERDGYRRQAHEYRQEAHEAQDEIERLRGLIREAYFEGALDGWLHVPNPTDQQIEPWWEDSDVRRELEARSDG